jgi:transcriptional regulator
MAVYIPPAFAPDDRAAISRLMHDYPFATLLTPQPGEPQITHLPLLHVADCEPHGTLFGHFARANPHAERAHDAESIAVFHGPHAYVSPSWYGDPADAVPTWNYAVVHAHGTLQLAQDAAETRALLDALINRFEGLRSAPWKLGLSPARLDAMVRGIVGFRLRIKRIEAKFKLSQNRSSDDRRRVVLGLAQDGHPDAEATAAWMRAYVAGADGER